MDPRGGAAGGGDAGGAGVQRTASLTTVALVAAALLAFAANSLLARYALRGDLADPLAFTLVRLATGAAMLHLITWESRFPRRRMPAPVTGEGGDGPAPAEAGGWPAWRGGLLLVLYAVPFSLAYLGMGAGTGALLLFGAVQVTLLTLAVLHGTRPSPRQWRGVALAFGGVTWLVLPGLYAPPVWAAALMLLAGAAWGGYSWVGRGGRSPTLATRENFVRAVPIATICSVLVWGTGVRGTMTPAGGLAALASGALASGLGYAVWYRALRRITAVQAAVAQLAVPALTAAGAVLLLGEPLTSRLVVAGAAILGGIALTVVPRRAAPR